MKINYISTKALVEKDNNGNPFKVSGVCFDITEMKKGAEKDYFNLMKICSVQTKSLNNLPMWLLMISRNLCVWSRALPSCSHQRYKDKLDQDARISFSLPWKEPSGCRDLINDLLDYSRIQTRGKKFVLVDMHEILGSR